MTNPEAKAIIEANAVPVFPLQIVYQDWLTAIHMAEEALEKQATSNSKQAISEWIPVSERLPKEDYDTVLVFLESKIYDIAIWHSEYGFRPWYAGYFEEATPEWESKVLAWMPLPEPYKEGE